MEFGRITFTMVPLLLPLLLLTAPCNGQPSRDVFRTPSADADSCRMFAVTSSFQPIARFLQEHFGALPCPINLVVNSTGYCVEPKDSDRCQPKEFFTDPNYVGKRCSENPTLTTFADPYSCANYYNCSSWYATSIGCPIGFLYNDVSKKCDRFDKVQCNEREVDLSPKNLEQVCSRFPDMVMADPTTCNRFYNCSQVGDLQTVFPPYHDECDYLLLWDTKTLSCQPYDQVQCHNRQELKYPCDLVQFECRSSHCRPCFVDYPDCTDLPDGYIPVSDQMYTPKFAMCKQGRVLETRQCSSVSLGRGLVEPRLFDPGSSACVSVNQVPRSLGGAGEEVSSKGDN